MQPYIFPYIGYYQLINSVDTFVILDDVNFIMRGWINRNNILVNNSPYLFSIPLDSPSQNKLILETKLKFLRRDKDKFLKTIQMSYKKSKFFNEFYPVLEEIILNEEQDLTIFLQNSFIKTLNYLGIKKTIKRSSELDKKHFLRAESRIIEICKQLKTDTYINLPGGKSIYRSNNFKDANISLQFINTLFDEIKYKQYSNEFIPNLSFLDIAFFNSKVEIKNLLDKYTLATGD